MALACLTCVLPLPGDAPCPTCATEPAEVGPLAPGVEADPRTGRQLFDLLRHWRGRQAGVQRLEAYMVLPNKTLAVLALTQPESRSALLAVDGIGPVKDRTYGYTLVRWFRQVRSGEPGEGPDVVPAPVPDGLTPDEEALLHEIRTAAGPVSSLGEARGWDRKATLAAVQSLIIKGAPDVAHMLVAPLDMAAISGWLQEHPKATPDEVAAAFPDAGALTAPVMVALAALRRRQADEAAPGQ